MTCFKDPAKFRIGPVKIIFAWGIVETFHGRRCRDMAAFERGIFELGRQNWISLHWWTVPEYFANFLQSQEKRTFSYWTGVGGGHFRLLISMSCLSCHPEKQWMQHLLHFSKWLFSELWFERGRYWKQFLIFPGTSTPQGFRCVAGGIGSGSFGFDHYPGSCCTGAWWWSQRKLQKLEYRKCPDLAVFLIDIIRSMNSN